MEMHLEKGWEHRLSGGQSHSGLGLSLSDLGQSFVSLWASWLLCLKKLQGCCELEKLQHPRLGISEVPSWLWAQFSLRAAWGALTVCPTVSQMANTTSLSAMHWTLPRRYSSLSYNSLLQSILLPTVGKSAAEMLQASYSRGPESVMMRGPSLGWEREIAETGKPDETPARHSSEGSPVPLYSHELHIYDLLHRCTHKWQSKGSNTVCISSVFQHLSFEILGMKDFDWIGNPFPLSREISTFTSVKEN